MADITVVENNGGMKMYKEGEQQWGAITISTNYKGGAHPWRAMEMSLQDWSVRLFEWKVCQWEEASDFDAVEWGVCNFLTYRLKKHLYSSIWYVKLKNNTTQVNSEVIDLMEESGTLWDIWRDSWKRKKAIFYIKFSL